MREWKYLKPLDTMERITRQELIDRFDSILNEVDAEDVGVVILGEDGNDEFVLCPARWMEYCFDKDFGCIISCAIRYAIRRETYMPNVVADFVRKYLHVLDSNTIKVAIEDIDSEINMGSVPYPGIWLSLRQDLLKQQAYLLEKNAILNSEESHNEKPAERTH